MAKRPNFKPKNPLKNITRRYKRTEEEPQEIVDEVLSAPEEAVDDTAAEPIAGDDAVVSDTGDPTQIDDESSADDESRETTESAVHSSFVPGSPHGDNADIMRIFNTNFMDYASYVIKDRAIPDVDDGLKPVQRRILWSLLRMDDGKFIKVANVIGHTMQFHPHGDQAIGDALILLANKELYIEKQGNFGNVLTGDISSAPRYIECRLSNLGKEVLFNNDITTFIDSYDGRSKEPVRLPVKIPSLLMMGASGVAVGMSTEIPPHNFCEAIQAQIAILKNEPFVLYPDYPHGGLLDVSEYDRGRGRLRARAKIERDGRRLVIRELPADTTTEALIASIEKQAKANKIKIQEIHDYTAEHIEIEIIPTRGYDPEQAVNALYAYTDCEKSLNINMLVICEHRPVIMSVDEILLRNTGNLLHYLRMELQLKLNALADKHLSRTLERIFIEERIYKRIEQCRSKEAVFEAVYAGLQPFSAEFNRALCDDDIERLLAIPIRRISLFDIEKNRDEIAALNAEISQTLDHLAHLKVFAINYLRDIIKKFGSHYPRRTQIVTFERADMKKVALSNIKVGWDRKSCLIGRNVKSDDTVTCTEFDRLLCVARDGTYKVVRIPDKLFVDKIYDFRRFDPANTYAVIYTDKKSGKVYWKRFKIAKALNDKEYAVCPSGARLELFTTRLNAVYTLKLTGGKEPRLLELNLWEAPERAVRSRGLLLGSAYGDLKFKTCVDEESIVYAEAPQENDDADAEALDDEEEADFELDDVNDAPEEEGDGLETDGWTFSREQTAPLRQILDEAATYAQTYNRHIDAPETEEKTDPTPSDTPPLPPIPSEPERVSESTPEPEEHVETQEAAPIPESEPITDVKPKKRGRRPRVKVETPVEIPVEAPAVAEEAPAEEKTEVHDSKKIQIVNTEKETPSVEPPPAPEQTKKVDATREKGAPDDWGIYQEELGF